MGERMKSDALELMTLVFRANTYLNAVWKGAEFRDLQGDRLMVFPSYLKV